MARDFDFTSRAKTNNSKTPLIKPEPLVALQPAKRQRTQKSTGRWPMILLVIGLVAAAIALYLQYRQADSSGSSNQPASSVNLDAIGQTQVTVHVYSSQSDLSSCRDLANRITNQGYRANCVGQSLAEHSQTEIWALADFQNQAQQINSTQGLNAQIQTLSSDSQSQIIIYIGKG
jgi:hypothetical protein